MSRNDNNPVPNSSDKCENYTIQILLHIACFHHAKRKIGSECKLSCMFTQHPSAGFKNSGKRINGIIGGMLMFAATTTNAFIHSEQYDSEKNRHHQLESPRSERFHKIPKPIDAAFISIAVIGSGDMFIQKTL